MDELPDEITQLDDAVYRHIGKIVHTGAALESAATVLLAWLASPDDPGKVRPFVQGRRLSDLTDLLAQMLPDYTDRAPFIKALRRTNDYRDRLAHSSRGFVPEDVGNIGVQWLVRERRRERDSLRLDMADLAETEAEHTFVLATLQVLEISLVYATTPPPIAASISAQLRQAAANGELEAVFMDPTNFLAGVDRLLEL